ncbi:hypothetical protein ESB00_18865 [Oleiharenicola lentus]|uniref:HEAT repeat domain-containing protein n=1 Tax=Oleiharenicola lentus TaxID=2508720 RepID=A0A4Q1C608_9BACT|nr:hypothetical protein [Oleiharenicola lentus]RXK53749.1 hypothetical protein ESB00_18865 [Oleiharenicola lentus]
MPTPLDLLAEGLRYDAPRVAAAAALVLAQPERVDELFDGLADDNVNLRNRASGALKTVSAQRPDLLLPYKRELLTRVARLDHWIVRSHLCEMLPRLTNLTAAERRRALALARGWMEDRSSIVKAVALDCIVQLSLAPGFATERVAAAQLVEECVAHGETPALRARARLLRKQLAKLARAARA